MNPIEEIAQPKNGHENSDFLARKRTWTGIAASNAGMSSQDSWLDMKTTGVSRGTRSAPSTRNRTNPPSSTRRAQIRAPRRVQSPRGGMKPMIEPIKPRDDRVDEPQRQEDGGRKDVEEQHARILSQARAECGGFSRSGAGPEVSTD